MIGAVFFAYTLEASGRLGTDLWLSFWSTEEYVKFLIYLVVTLLIYSTSSPESHSVKYYLSIYFSLGLTVCFLVLTRATIFYMRAIVAARELHNGMLYRGMVHFWEISDVFIVLKAPMSFFDTTPIGKFFN